MINQVLSIRGATTVDGDNVKSITERSVELINTIIEENGLKCDNIEFLNCVISTTKDITAFYPARAIRESGVIDTPLFSCVEPDIKGSLELCIRIMLTVVNLSDRVLKPKHIYLHNAKQLRKDLTENG